MDSRLPSLGNESNTIVKDGSILFGINLSPFQRLSCLGMALVCGISMQAQNTFLSKEEAVSRTLEKNLGIVVAKNNVEVAENNKSILNSGFLPSLTATAGADYNRSDFTTEFPGQFLTDADGNVVVDPGTGAAVPRPDIEVDKAESQRYNAGLNLNYTLFDGFGRWYDFKILKEQYNLNELQARETIENTVIQLFTVYYEVARVSENVDILEETLESTQQRLKRAEYSFDYGQNNKLDVLNAEVDLVTDSINLLDQQQLLKNTIRDLNVILNANLENTFSVDTTATFVTGLELENILNEAEENNVQLLQVRSNKTINKYNIKAAKSVFLPTIGLTGSYGWNLNQSARSAFFPGVNTDTWALGLGANLTWNLFDGGSNLTQLKNAKVLLRSQDAAIEQREQEVKRDIANANGIYGNRLQVYKMLEQNVITAQHNFDRTNEQYKLGQLTSVELRQAQLNLLNARTSKNTAKYNAKLAELELLRLAGQLLNSKF